MTIRLGYLLSFSIRDFCLEKSMYASSMIIIPGKTFRRTIISSYRILLPVGLLGEQMKSSFELAVFVTNIFSTSNWNCAERFTFLICTSLRLALTSYMPYVGGQIITLSV